MVQASLKLVLEPIFEAGFKPCSYGFRPNRRAHDAIAEIHYFTASTRNYHWVLECDIKACFDEISHTALMDRLRVRIKDKRVCALVKAFLKSGVLTELGNKEETLTGTPQGGILSPLLANIALSALDDHFDQQWQQEMKSGGQRAKRRRHGQGNWRLVRYCTLCRRRHNVHKTANVLAALPKSAHPGAKNALAGNLGRRGQAARPGGGEGVRGCLRGQVPQGSREDHR